MNNRIIILASLLLSMISTVNAEEKSYAEIGFGSLAVEDSGWRFVPKIGRLIVGTKVMDGLAIEGMAAVGFVDSSVGGITLKVNNAVGLYARPFVNVGDSVELYARLGYFKGSMTISGAGGSISDSGSGVSYGGGIAFKITPTTAATIDYMSYYDKDGMQIYGATVGARYAF